MVDYCEIFEHIKLSEAKVAKISKDIKDVEAEIKSLDGEIEIMKAKEKQLQEELSYKRKIVHEKEWELGNLKRQHEIWRNMQEEQEIILQRNKEKLGQMQKSVWDTRISFYDKTMDFLSKNDVLSNGDELESIIKNQKEKIKLEESNSALECELNVIENKHNEMKGRYDLLSHLEKEKESLLEYEQSYDIIRLQRRIDSYNKELESLDLELAKYNGRTGMDNDEVGVVKKLKHCNEDRIDATGLNTQKNEEQVPGDLEYSEKKQSFKPKVPSLLLRKPQENKTV